MATPKGTQALPAHEGPQASRDPAPKDYDAPDNYQYRGNAFARPPVPNAKDDSIRQASTIEDESSAAATASCDHQLARPHTAEREARMTRRHSGSRPTDYDLPNAFANLDELAISPVENPGEERIYKHRSLEQARRQEHDYVQDERSAQSGRRGQHPTDVDAEKAGGNEGNTNRDAPSPVSRLATQFYSLSYLVFFAVFGTLARLGLQALTSYPGTPVSFSSIWPNFSGSLVMGFLAEDRMLFRDECGTPTYENLIQEAQIYREKNGSSEAPPHINLTAAKKAHLAAKKTIPLYIGLATGFCGSFTSFSAFIRDIFLALSNNMAANNDPRNGGYSFMALMGVVIITVSMSLGGLLVGAHLAIALEPVTPSIPYAFTRKVLDPVIAVLGWGCWIGAITMSAIPPDDSWRGKATFALVFAPLGCLARFYVSLYLNGRIASFPLGTFVVNIVGTLILGMSWDLAHVPLGGVVGCQVLQGVEDGFCGCLTTVSTWVAELSSLRRRNAYIYGASSVLVGLAAMVAVMGGLKWSDGFSALQCTH